jgi:hypothetical protein
MKTLPSSRREALTRYLMEVARDLAMRGVIRWKKGQAFEAILRAEGDTILREIRSDLTAVAMEIGVSVIGNGLPMLVKWATDKVTGQKR